jgi:hypothetical protein
MIGLASYISGEYRDPNSSQKAAVIAAVTATSPNNHKKEGFVLSRPDCMSGAYGFEAVDLKT